MSAGPGNSRLDVVIHPRRRCRTILRAAGFKMITCERFGFVHIPKASGSSINSVMRRHFGDDMRMVSVFDFANFGDELADIPLLSGHVPYFFFEMEEAPRTLFTVLRDPSRRVISTFRYILTTKAHYAHGYVTSRGLSLAQCFDHPVLRIEMTNFQTKMLGWRPLRALSWPAHGREKLGDFFSVYNEFLHGDVDRSTVDAAIDHLSRGMVVAMTESEDSLSSLSNMITGASLFPVPHENKTPDTLYEVTPEDLEAIEQHNRWDNELYRAAQALMAAG